MECQPPSLAQLATAGPSPAHPGLPSTMRLWHDEHGYLTGRSRSRLGLVHEVLACEERDRHTKTRCHPASRLWLSQDCLVKVVVLGDHHPVSFSTNDRERRAAQSKEHSGTRLRPRLHFSSTSLLALKFSRRRITTSSSSGIELFTASH